jgi:hypothetical protein
VSLGGDGDDASGTAGGGSSSGGTPQEQTGGESADPSGDASGDGASGGAEEEPGGDASAGTGPEDGSSGETGSGEGDGGEGDGGDGPSGTEPENDPDAGLPDSPAGYTEVTDGDFHFRMSLPGGWERTGIAGQNSGGIYSAPGGGAPKVQVDFNGSPGDDAAAAWRDLEPAVERNSADYRRLSIEPVSWRGYPTVADWQFERTEDGERVRVLNRGFRVDDDHGYAIMITCPADAWDEEECTTLRETAFATFQPLD